MKKDKCLTVVYTDDLKKARDFLKNNKAPFFKLVYRKRTSKLYQGVALNNK